MTLNFARLSVIVVVGATFILLTLSPSENLEPVVSADEKKLSGASWNAESLCPPGVDCQEQPVDVADARVAWNQFWEKADEGRLDQVQTVGGARMSQVVSAGDTVWMRYPRLWPELAASQQRQFIQVSLTDDLERRTALLLPLTTDSVPAVAYRARLEMARSAWRSGDLAATVRTARDALAVEGLAEPLRADAFLLLAMVAYRQSRLVEAEALLREAISRDGAFRDAHWLLLSVVASRLDESGKDAALCLDRAHRLLSTLMQLPRLAADTAQFLDLAANLEKGVGGRSAAGLLAAGAAWQWGGRPDRAGPALLRAKEFAQRLPSDCGEPILERARALMSAPVRQWSQ